MVHLRCVVHLWSSLIRVKDVGVFFKHMAKSGETWDFTKSMTTKG